MVAELLLGAHYLGVELLLDWHHRRLTCPHLDAGFDAVEAPWRARER